MNRTRPPVPSRAGMTLILLIITDKNQCKSVKSMSSVFYLPYFFEKELKNDIFVDSYQKIQC